MRGRSGRVRVAMETKPFQVQRSTREGMASSSGEGCLCLERQGEGGRHYFHTVSSFIQKFLHEVKCKLHDLFITVWC